MRLGRLYTVLALAVLALSLGPVGAAVFVLGFLHGDSPCVLCWEQRTGMILVALTGCFILRFGPRPRYIGLGILVSLHGLYMAARQSALHAARDVGQGFSVEILGAHTYTWSALVFFVCVATMGLLLLLTPDGEARGAVRDPGRLGRAAMVVFLATVAANVVQAFASTGPPPYMGQSDPVRFSFRPRNWVWSLEEWQPASVSWRGRWDVEKPSLAGLPGGPRSGPLGSLAVLPRARQMKIGVTLNGAVTDLSHDDAGGRFLVTTDRNGVYVLDGGLGSVLRHTVVDAGFSVDLGTFAGAAFLDGDTVMALGQNKSYVVLKEKDGADARANFRYFLESFDRFDEVTRGRFATVRARLNYVMSLAFDPQTASLYTLAVPNRRHPRIVVSRFDRKDLTLSEEYLPRLAGGLVLGEKRSLDEYHVTGAAVASGRLYALSAAYGTLLVLDLAAREVVSAYALEGATAPSGLALRGEELLVASADGTVSVYGRP